MRKIIILIAILAMAISCSTNAITGLNKKNGNFENSSNSSEGSNSNNQENGSSSSGNQGSGGNNSLGTTKEKLKVYIENKLKNPMETDRELLFTGLNQFTKPSDISFDLYGEDANVLIAMSAQKSLHLKVIDIEGVDKESCKNNKKVKELLNRGGSYSGQVVDLSSKKFSTDVFNIEIKRDTHTGKISIKMTPEDKLAKELKQYVINSKNTGVIKVTIECSTDKIKKAPNTIELYIVVSSI